MNPQTWMILFVGLFGIVVLALLFWPWKGGRMRAVPGRDGYQEAAVLVGETAFVPGVILARPGQPVRLTFRREARAPRCTGKVHLLAFGKAVRLPAGEAVSVEIMPERPGVYTFGCPRQKFRGRLIVARA
ncbi:cupredoxin domain-containing protein [Rhodocaloribacter sp.]